MTGQFKFTGSKYDNDFIPGKVYKLNIDQYQDGVEIQLPFYRLYHTNKRFYKEWKVVSGRQGNVNRFDWLFKMFNRLGK